MKLLLNDVLDSSGKTFASRRQSEVASVSALKALTGMIDSETRLIPDVGWYRYDISSAEAGDDDAVVEPDSGTGRWKKQGSAGATPVLNDTTIGWIDSEYHDDLAAMVTELGGNQNTLRLRAGVFNETSNVTVPINGVLRMEQGAILKPASGVTIAINGAVQAGNYKIFDLSAGGSITLAGGAEAEIPVQWFGATGDGSTDDHDAVQNTFTALGGNQSFTVVFPAPSSEYIVSSKITIPSGIKWIKVRGGGAATKIRTTNATGQNLFEFASKDCTISFENLYLTGNANSGHGIYSDNAYQNWITIKDCVIRGFTGTNKFGIFCDHDYRVQVQNCEVQLNWGGVYLKEMQYGCQVSSGIYRDNSSGYQIYVEDAFGFDLSGCLIAGTYSGATSVDMVRCVGVAGISINGNKFDTLAAVQNDIQRSMITLSNQPLYSGASYTYGCEGVSITGNGFEVTSGFTSYTHARIIRIEYAASAVSITGNKMFHRNSSVEPVEIITTDDAESPTDSGRIKNIGFSNNYYDGIGGSTKLVKYNAYVGGSPTAIAYHANRVNIKSLDYEPMQVQFYELNLAAGGSTFMKCGDSSIYEFYMPRDGYLRGISAHLNAAISAGTIELTIFGKQLDVNVQNVATWWNDWEVKVNKGDYLRVLCEPDISVLPTGSLDLTVQVFIALDNNDPI